MAGNLQPIGEAARQSGVSVRMIRHYERLGLLPAVARTEAGYRQYGRAEVHTLQFIKRSRELGFSVPEIAQLLELWQNRQRSSADVRSIAQQHLLMLRQRIAEMQAMHETLASLVQCCQGDARPECPILEDLASPRHRKAPAPSKATAEVPAVRHHPHSCASPQASRR
ncbi:Cu(I)-responsive transcriptional regulator [Corticibacter populi]|uniref:Cu(I)-responsive transcriptional regulator n=1 Tax=Corticibacter populi TaxID=1550736 RepID=A0A3M6QIV8_9BURK|nr:Cu(I)-responsive transcriptional regulator [Corticibacter populi]RMX03004.1 Cu(I)-responsive transcriptional regulator [Corticibacter populi]RZS33434.1 Cu(I)-responsive transcriptional regulator [Corticibacter populi]